MVDRGPLLTSAIIFYLSIGAAIFQVLEEPNWKKATKEFDESKTKILDKYTCLTLKDLEEILEVRDHSNCMKSLFNPGSPPSCTVSDAIALLLECSVLLWVSSVL